MKGTSIPSKNDGTKNHLSELEDQFVDDLFNIFIIYRINQDLSNLLQRNLSNPSRRNQVVFVFVETDRPGLSVKSSQITGNEVF
jgi:hypothetical protein